MSDRHGRNEPAVIQATYSDLKIVKTRKVLQIMCEIPLERMEEFIAKFGAPKADEERWVAIALLTERPEGFADREAVAAQDKTVQRCVMLCKEERFRRWLCRTPDAVRDPGENAAIEELYRELKITSRKEIGTNPVVKQAWLDLLGEYEREEY